MFDAKRFRIGCIGEALHMKNHIILDDRRGMGPVRGIADDPKELIDPLPRVAQKRFIVVKLLAKIEKVRKRAVDGQAVD